MRSHLRFVAGLALCFAIFASAGPAAAVTPTRQVRPGESLSVPASSGYEVLVNDCGQHNTTGPSGTTFQIVPAGAASLSGANPNASLSTSSNLGVRVSPDVHPGVSITVSWTTFHDGCFSAHGGVTLQVVASSRTCRAAARGCRRPVDPRAECKILLSFHPSRDGLPNFYPTEANYGESYSTIIHRLEEIEAEIAHLNPSTREGRALKTLVTQTLARQRAFYPEVIQLELQAAAEGGRWKADQSNPERLQAWIAAHDAVARKRAEADRTLYRDLGLMHALQKDLWKRCGESAKHPKVAPSVADVRATPAEKRLAEAYREIHVERAIQLEVYGPIACTPFDAAEVIATLGTQRVFKWAVTQLGGTLFSQLSGVPTEKCSGMLWATALAERALAEQWFRRALDPPDPRFRVIAIPAKPRYAALVAPPGSRGAALATQLSSLARNYAEQRVLLDATTTSMERAQGALLKGDRRWAKRQLKAARRYARTLAARVRAETTIGRSALSALQRAAVPATLSAAQVRGIQAARVLSEPPSDVAAGLVQLGFSAHAWVAGATPLVTASPEVLARKGVSAAFPTQGDAKLARRNADLLLHFSRGR